MADVVVNAVAKTCASDIHVSSVHAVRKSCDRASKIAREDKLLVFPAASGEACRMIGVSYVETSGSICSAVLAQQSSDEFVS